MPEKVVVDLHLTEIIDDESGMSPKEMLDYQMKVFREKLDECIADAHVKKVVFIHGKGNGSLKLELRKCLDRNYKRCQYQDASFEEYGGGATLVYVK
jgi:dsDNA-specific endonuclease/ATPase MutS2